MKRILVTGANGQLGTTLKQQSLGSEDQWVFCGREVIDITDMHSITSFLEKQSFDCCINCAAYNKVDDAETEIDAAYALNLLAVKNLVAACNEKQITLLHISTDYVFDGTKKTPYVETDPTAPLNQYGKSKLQGEHYIQQKAKAFYIIRTSWLYSKTLGANFYSAILNKAKNGETLTVVNDQVGTPTDVVHLAEFLFQMIKKEPEYGLYHFSDEQIMSWYDLAVAIVKEHQLEVPVTPSTTSGGGAVRPTYSPLFSNKQF
ncbi:dTDP-4-dehydrorhamnose reductase [Flavobacteriaceae bacterium]|nr:dTDP-4-dehydrorhamnose reductase [Flavobacteriaceae bacterium]